jgi:GNAT superfamily N-acetyltransferase
MITFSLATQAEIPVLAEILTAAYRYKLKHGDTSWGSSRSDIFTNKEVAQQLTMGITYLAYLEDRAVGTYLLQWDDREIWGEQPPNAGYLHRLAITKGQHGYNIGQQLITHAAGEVRAKQRRFLRLDCIAANGGLCTYYEKHGFQLVETRQTSANPHLSALYQLVV